MPDVTALCGWVDDPSEVEQVVGRMRYPIFALAAPELMAVTEHRDVMLWDLEQKLLGRILDANRQTIGDCVSHGWAAGVRYLVLRELVSVGAGSATFSDIATEPIYALSRVEVGKGRLGSGDGSIGAWAAEGVQAPYGVLQRKAYGSVDLTTYSGQRAKEWGRPRAGLPDDLERLARDYPVTAAPMVRTDDEASAALMQYYPIPVCSGQGFTETRDRYGFCDPQGSWAHCMCAIAYVRVKRGTNNVLAVAIKQSWGNNSPSGPDEFELSTGEKRKLPPGVFLIEFDVFVNRMLRRNDSFAPAGVRGFVRMPDFTF